MDQLREVRGLGKTRALEIARFRDRHGPFKSLAELNQVPHMGDMPYGELDEVKTPKPRLPRSCRNLSTSTPPTSRSCAPLKASAWSVRRRS